MFCSYITSLYIIKTHIMKSILTSFIIVLLTISCASPKKNNDLVVINQPAEFETQEAIWLIWPSNNHKESESVENVTLSIIEALIGDIDIVVTCKNKELLNRKPPVLPT
jgi:agmatine deiminase